MVEDALEELVGIEPKPLGSGVAMIEVAEADVVIAMADQPFRMQRPALGVTREIGEYAPTMGVARADVHVEVLAIKRRDAPQPMGVGLLGR